MKIMLPFLGMALLFPSGCSHSPPALDPHMQASFQAQSAFDTWTVESIQETMVNNSLIEQHAIYAYHFMPQSAALTELGEHHLTLLADRYKEQPGSLVLVRGDAPDELYTQRRATVMAALKAAAIPDDRVTIVDGLPGAKGLASQYIVDSISEKKKSYSGSSTDTGSMTTTGMTAAQESEGAR
jgi:hypothetical protein